MVRGAACLLCVIALLPASRIALGAVQDAAAKRVAERLADLKQEAALLNSREQTLLSELRKLEIERQIRSEELVVIDGDLRTTKEQLAVATARAATLRQSADAQRPEVQDRLVRLYKMGRAGYWRLLLDVDDLQSIGRAYRTAAAMTRLDHDRVQEHQQTLVALDRERSTLETRAREFSAMQGKAAQAQLALDRAVASRAALMASIHTRRDLAAQFARELEAAHRRLQSAVAEPGGSPVLVPHPPVPRPGAMARRRHRCRPVRTATAGTNGWDRRQP